MDSEMLRGKPLSKDETKSLLDLIASSKIILSKTTNASSNKMKIDEWSKITNTFNATATVCRRTPQQLRLKWENLKKNARKRSTRIRMNRIQTGSGIPGYIPPDDILDRVADLLGSSATGFVVQFGGDKEIDHFATTNVDDGSMKTQGKVPLPSDSIPVSIENVMSTAIQLSTNDSMAAIIPFSDEIGIDTSIPVCTDAGTSTSMSGSVHNVVEVTKCELTPTPGQSTAILHAPSVTPQRFTMNIPRRGKKCCKGKDTKAARDIAIAEYFALKKQCLDVKLQNILLENEKLKLEIDKLKNKD